MAVTDDVAENVVKEIQENANTRKIGDGKFLVFDTGEAVRIRTGEKDADAF